MFAPRGIAIGLLVSVHLAPAFSFAQSDTTSTPIPPLQINVRNVLVDVVVTDANGGAIRDLSRSDFQVFENGRQQQIEFFEPHITSASTAPASVAPLPPNTFTNVPPVRPKEAINVLLMDALNTTSADQIYVRRQMLQYLDSLPPGLRVGVFVLGDRLRIIQGFTDDSRVLHASIERLANKPREVALESTPDELAQQSNSLNDLSTMTVDPGGINATGGAEFARMISNLQDFLAKSTEVQQNQQLLMTLEALQAIAHYVSDVPGRKNLVWFVGSFPLCLPGPRDGTPFGCPYPDQVEKTWNALAAARVSVYPIDAGGISGTPSGNIGGKGTNQADSLVPGATLFSNVTSDAPRNRFTASESWAEATGGKAAHHNDIKGAIAKALADGSSYYTIAYNPLDTREIGRERRIEIRVPEHKYNLSYRRAYFERTPAEIKAASTGPDHDPLRPLMDRGMPNFSDLKFRIHVEPILGQPATGERLSGDNPGLTTPLHRYTVRFFLSPQELNLVAGPDGVRRAPVEVALVAYSQQGQSLNWLIRSVNLAIRPDQMAFAQTNGIPFHFDFDIPPGDVYLRAGIYEPGTQRAGTLEIPVASIRTSLEEGAQ